MRSLLKKLIDFFSPSVPKFIKKPLRKWYIYLFFGLQKLEKDTFDRLPIEFSSRENKIPPAKKRPPVSIVIISYNNWILTKNCINSILKYSDYPRIEIIVIDNQSDDETRADLVKFAARLDCVKTILNDDNRGFAAANNQGAKIANGEYVIYLNNDTIVTPGWIDGFLHHFELNERIGLLGPVTSNTSTIQMIPTGYYNLEDMLTFADQIRRRKKNSFKEVRMIALFCVIALKKTIEQVDGLSEEYGLGYFEDDDLCRKVEKLGLKIGFAEDVFIHHIGGASFDKVAFGPKRDLFLRNKKIYEEKWGEWEPPGRR